MITARHRIEDEEETKGKAGGWEGFGGQLRHQSPPRINGLEGGGGGHFTPCHSVFVYRGKSVTWSSVLRGGGRLLRGREEVVGGGFLHFLERPPGTGCQCGITHGASTAISHQPGQALGL